MTATITYSPGKFVWRELFTTDVEAAKAFYGGLFGWTVEARPMGDAFIYHVWKNGDAEIGGMMAIADLPGGGGGMPPAWACYVSVEDVDKAAAIAVAHGGQLLGDCHDIPHVGRFAVLADPFGAVFNLFKRSAGDGPEAEPQLHDFCWENLVTPDADASIAFYEQVLPWGHETMPDGETKLFNRNAGTCQLASIGPSPDGKSSHWGTFVAVADVDASLKKAQDLGAQVLLPKTDISVGAFAILQDPLGAVIFVYRKAS